MFMFSLRVKRLNMFMFSLRVSVSARLPLTKSKKKTIIESTAIKQVCQCTDRLSATQNAIIEPVSPDSLQVCYSP